MNDIHIFIDENVTPKLMNPLCKLGYKVHGASRRKRDTRVLKLMLNCQNPILITQDKDFSEVCVILKVKNLRLYRSRAMDFSWIINHLTTLVLK